MWIPTRTFWLVIIMSVYFLRFQARNRSGQVGYVPEKYLQLPSSNSLMSMLQALAALDARSHSSSNSTEPETELPTGSVNGDSSGEEPKQMLAWPVFFVVSTEFVWWLTSKPALLCFSVICEGSLRLRRTNGRRAVVSRRRHHPHPEQRDTRGWWFLGGGVQRHRRRFPCSSGGGSHLCQRERRWTKRRQCTGELMLVKIKK